MEIFFAIHKKRKKSMRAYGCKYDETTECGTFSQQIVHITQFLTPGFYYFKEKTQNESVYNFSS